ncbi:hypothetical protein KJ644_01475 [Candidatus Dependentiae bacterium]|nr:hypothetical protein [Candidatus Dependentiae bacterium]MBU4387122.1 hypothetical protein [Candidatus Dependentiae bacterium]MCG2756079.1 hypothetical protein [Candidatus Dependentiae bacterium]
MFFKFSKNPLVDKIKEIFEFLNKNKKQAIYWFAGFLVFILVTVGYIVYRSGADKRAYKDLIKSMAVFDGKVVTTVTDGALNENEFKTEAEKWERVVSVFDDMYKKHKRSGIAPIFLSYKVDALINLSKLAPAIEAQNLLLKIIPNKSALKQYNKIKLALMQIDSEKDENIKNAIEILNNIALDNNNIAQDQALYRLGEYYWYRKDYTQAANFWNQLTIKFGKSSAKPSIWVDLANPKLKTITV